MTKPIEKDTVFHKVECTHTKGDYMELYYTNVNTVNFELFSITETIETDVEGAKKMIQELQKFIDTVELN
ncbi:hypothetical protein OB988_18785 [Bacillus cereus]|nr:hypothetical protein [Bacillus cereus]